MRINRIDKLISIPKSFIISCDALIMDNDFHSIRYIDSGKVNNLISPVYIGKNCWLGARSLVLKGASVEYNTIITANSVLTKKYTNENVLLAGNPALIKKRGACTMR